MKIAVKREQNGLIYLDTNSLVSGRFTEEQMKESPYNFQIREISELYKDNIQSEDFDNENLEFDLQRYLSRNEKNNTQQELDTLLNNLANTDYIANKLIEAETEQEREQIRQEYAETLAQRRVWRNRASELKDMLEQE